jgi:hypothetical protein
MDRWQQHDRKKKLNLSIKIKKDKKELSARTPLSLCVVVAANS